MKGGSPEECTLNNEPKPQPYMKRELNQNVSGNEVQYTNSSIFTLTNMPCSKLHCQKVVTRFPFNMKPGTSAVRHAPPHACKPYRGTLLMRNTLPIWLVQTLCHDIQLLGRSTCWSFPGQFNASQFNFDLT